MPRKRDIQNKKIKPDPIFNNIAISTSGTQDEGIQRSKELSEKLYLDFSDQEMASDIFNILATTAVTDSLNTYKLNNENLRHHTSCLLYTSPSPRD